MLLQIGRIQEANMFKSVLGENRYDNAKKYYHTSDKNTFRNIHDGKKYLESFPKYPNKSFAFIFMRGLDFTDVQKLSKARTMATKGVIFNSSSLPRQYEQIVFKVSEIKRANKRYDEIKETNDNIISINKEKRKEVKAINKVARDKNKELEKEWKKEKKGIKKEFDEVLEKMDEAQKKFMPKEPDYPDEPKYIKLETEPPEPRLRDLPRSISIHVGENQLNRSYPIAWMMLSNFDLYKIEGTSYSIFIKKESSMKYSYDALDSLDIDKKMSIEDFKEFFDKNEKNEKVLENYRPSIQGNFEFMDVYSENDNIFSGKEWVYSEFDDDYDEDEEALPPLAPIKPMHAASILSGGMKFSKEIKTEEGYLLIKSAPVKVFSEKTKIINGKKILETYQQRETILAFYNLDQRELEVYGNA